ncbi:hypothetical protein ACFLU1_06770 [Chloroflexota bacterium]
MRKVIKDALSAQEASGMKGLIEEQRKGYNKIRKREEAILRSED